MRLAWNDQTSFDTESNASLAACALQPLGIRRIALVTDAWHMTRATLWFRWYGFEVTQVTAPIPADQRSRKDITLSAYHELGGIAEVGLAMLQGRRRLCPTAHRQWRSAGFPTRTWAATGAHPGAPKPRLHVHMASAEDKLPLLKKYPDGGHCGESPPAITAKPAPV